MALVILTDKATKTLAPIAIAPAINVLLSHFPYAARTLTSAFMVKNRAAIAIKSTIIYTILVIMIKELYRDQAQSCHVNH